VLPISISAAAADYTVYIVDRLKAFDRVHHMWLLRCAAMLCGVHLPVPQELLGYWADRRQLLRAWMLDPDIPQTDGHSEAVGSFSTRRTGKLPPPLACLAETPRAGCCGGSPGEGNVSAVAFTAPWCATTV
jgi:hypothetical protein